MTPEQRRKCAEDTADLLILPIVQSMGPISKLGRRKLMCKLADIIEAAIKEESDE